MILISSCGIMNKSKALTETQNTLRTDFTKYLDLIINKEFRKSMDYMVPEFFEILPKEDLIEEMEQTMNNPDIDIELKEPKILEIGKITKVANRFYSKLKYSSMINMKFKGEDEETKENEKMRIDFMQFSLEATFGSENVTYNVETDFFKVYSEQDIIAISDNGKSAWKFLVVDEKDEVQMLFLEQLVPEEVLNLK
mgnify:CR=1 FL=1